jgi:hypothetical protein
MQEKCAFNLLAGGSNGAETGVVHMKIKECGYVKCVDFQVNEKNVGADEILLLTSGTNRY